MELIQDHLERYKPYHFRELIANLTAELEIPMIKQLTLDDMKRGPIMLILCGLPLACLFFVFELIPFFELYKYLFTQFQCLYNWTINFK